MNKRIGWLAQGAFAAALAVVCLAGCATSGQPSRAERRAAATRQEVVDCLPPEGEAVSADVADLYRQLAENGNHEAVRYCYAIGIKAIESGRWEEAARVLDAAVLRLEGSSVGDRSAKKSRSAFHEESVKNFRGEPYEQVMIYMMRGLVYMQAGDFENARAMFRSGALTDQSSMDAPAEEQYTADVAEMDYLEALCNLKLNDPKASDCLERARQSARVADSVLAPPENFNAVVIVLAGKGPTKFRAGHQNQLLKFEPGTGSGGPIQVDAGGVLASSPGPVDNMTFQATTRGKRVIDGILKGKAIFKTTTAVVGDAAIVAGAAVALSDRDNVGVGVAIAAAGLATRLVSAAATAEADIRELQPIPDDIYVVPVRLPEGEQNAAMNGNACKVILCWSGN